MPDARYAKVYVSVPSVIDQQTWVEYFRAIQSPPGLDYRFCFRHALQGDWPRIQSMIAASDVVIADFSPTPESGIGPDPNVITEAAYARFGPQPKPLILLHRQSTLALPFDWLQLMKIGAVRPVSTMNGMQGAIAELSGWISQLLTQPAPPPPPPRQYRGTTWDVCVAQSFQRGDGSPGPAGFDFAQFYKAVRAVATRLVGGPKARVALVMKDQDEVEVWHRVQAAISHCAVLVAEFSPDAKSGHSANPDVITEAALAAFHYHVPILPVLQPGVRLPDCWSHLPPLVYDRHHMDKLPELLLERLQTTLQSVTAGTITGGPPVLEPIKGTTRFFQAPSAAPAPVGTPQPANVPPAPTSADAGEITPTPTPSPQRTRSQILPPRTRSASSLAMPAAAADAGAALGGAAGPTAMAASGPFQKFLEALREKNWPSALQHYKAAIALDPWQHALFNPERFVPEEILGAGPFGVVFRAKMPATPDEPRETPVVIKALLHPERLGVDPDDLFANMDLLRQAPRHGLLNILDWDRYPRGETNAYWHFWSPLHPGAESLESLVHKKGPLAESDARSIASGIVMGLMSAHLFHVPHLGLKPDNILVRRSGRKKWEVWLRDFGFVPTFVPKDTAPSWMVPLLDFAAPEQKGEIPITPGLTSDIYALGLNILYCLFGTAAVDVDVLEKLEALENQNLRQAVEGCLRYDPRSRWGQLEPILELLNPGTTPVSLRQSTLLPVNLPVVDEPAKERTADDTQDVFGGVSLLQGDAFDQAFAEDAVVMPAQPLSADEPAPEPELPLPLLRGATREEGPLRPVDKLVGFDRAPEKLTAMPPVPERDRPVPNYVPGVKKQLIAGIDLGTCNSVLAYIDDYGDIKVVHHTSDSIVTPSAVYFPEAFVAEVGLDAKRMAVFEPLNCAQYMKLSMGDARRAKIFHGTKFAPEMLSALVLRRLVEHATDELGGADAVEIKDVVVTVPSSWDDVRRDSTRLAAQLAGLNPIGILSEPVAVALEVSLKQLRDGKAVFVYDFGGGTFDVTIFKLDGKTVRLLGNMGLPTLGGNNLDQKLYDHVRLMFREEFADQNPPDPDNRPQSRWELLSRCEQVKIALCRKAPPQTITVSSGGCVGKYKIGLEDFERLIAPEVEMTRNFVLGALLEAGLKAKNIDYVLSVGGSSQIPLVQRMLADIFGAEKLVGKQVNPQETVARGACRNAADIWCEAVRRKELPPEALPKGLLQKLGDAPVLREETPQPLTVVTMDASDGETQYVEVVIPQGTPWPAQGNIRAVTAEDHQMNVICRIRSGMSHDVDGTERLGTISFPLIPGVPKGCPLKIEFWYDGPERLFASLWDGASNKVQMQRVPWPGPSPKQVAQWQEVIRETKVVID